MTSPAMITLTTTIAVIGEWVFSFTSASFSGISRSKDQAKNDRIGMNVLAIIDGRIQNKKHPRMITAMTAVLTASAARNGKKGPGGIPYAWFTNTFTADTKL